MLQNKQQYSNSSAKTVRVGSQAPKQRTANGPVVYSDADGACAISSNLGLDLFEWQRNVLEDWCAKDEHNRPAYITCGLDVPRQNGKNAALEAYEVLAMTVYGWHILHTAHRVKTTKKAFYRLVKYFTDRNHPEFSSQVETIRRTNGEESITLTNGASIEFASRTTGSARGYDDIQLVVYDEAQELTDSQFQSIDYAMSASTTDGGSRQKIFTGTPPYEGCNGTVFSRQRSAALNVTPGRTTWTTWACDHLPRKDATWDDVIGDVYECNPSMGLLLDIEYTETEFAGATIMGFAQERLDWWTPLRTVDHAIPKKLWGSCEIDEIGNKYPCRTTFGLKFEPDGSSAALVGCKVGKRGEAAVELVEIIDTSKGTRVLAEWLANKARTASCIWIDGLSGADALCDNLAEFHAPRGFVVRPSTADVVGASVNFLDGLKCGKLAHTPNEWMDRSATECVKRAIGRRGGWGFGSTDNTSSIVIEAAALAYYASRKTRRNPKKQQRIL